MELLADRRIELDARPLPARTAVIEAVFIGHCPPDDQPARWERLGRALDDIGSLGFEREVATLRAWSTPGEVGAAARETHRDEELAGLFGLPIPVYSLGQFQDIFKGAFDQPTVYRSRLAGDRAWLPLAVQDFFEQAGTLPDGAKKLWVIRVRESEGRAAFLPLAARLQLARKTPDAPPAFRPDPREVLLNPELQGAFERALLIRRAGILALPDLERLQVPAGLPDIPRMRLDNPEPAFLPVAQPSDDSHRERRTSDDMAAADERLSPARIVPHIARALDLLRPDLQCLYALPFDRHPRSESPQPAGDFLQHLAAIVAPVDPPAKAPKLAKLGKPDEPNSPPNFELGEPQYERNIAELAAKLRHIQFLYPYLRGPNRPLGSPSGLIAGMQVEVSQRRGPWCSVAGQALPGRCLPYPAVGQQLATTLRQTPGIGILVSRKGRAELDDERLVAASLPAQLVAQLRPGRRQADHLRSGEVMRFLGWLRRELEALGEQLVFRVDPGDPQPEMLLRDFLSRLHRLGALRGRLPEDAFRLHRFTDGEATLGFEIELAPAYAIDRIRLTFVHDRAAGGTRIEVGDA